VSALKAPQPGVCTQHDGQCAKGIKMMHLNNADFMEAFCYIKKEVSGNHAVVNIKADCRHFGIAITDIGKHSGGIRFILRHDLYGRPGIFVGKNKS